MKNCDQKKPSFGPLYVAYSIAIHGVIMAVFLYLGPDHLFLNQNDTVIEVLFHPRVIKEIPRPFALPAPPKAIAKKPRLYHQEGKVKPTAPLTLAAAATENSGQKMEQEGLVAASVDVRKTPVLLNKDEVAIPYPKRALQFMIEGVVRLRLTVSEHGLVIKVKILSGPQFGLQNAALSVARKLIFLPATDEHGHARASDIVHDVIFRLKS